MLKILFMLVPTVGLLVGCAAQSSGQPSGVTREQAAANRARPYVEGQAAVARFADAPGCEGPEAAAIKANIAELERSVQMFHGLLRGLEQEARERHTDLSFSFADQALKKGCFDEADQTYRGLISFYTGAAYSGIRDRARLGVDDVRAAKRDKRDRN